MNAIESRVRENFPTILMTIVSLIVALVYENLIGSLNEQAGLWSWTQESAFVWSQCIFMLVGPLAFWFAHSLFSCSVRPVFAREDVLVPILAAIAFNVLASNLGTAHAGVWLIGSGSLSLMGFFAMGQFARRYRDDPALSPPEHVHQRSRRTMLVAGVVLVVTGLLFQMEIIGYGLATALLVAMTPVLAAAVFIVWFAEWSETVRLARA